MYDIYDLLLISPISMLVSFTSSLVSFTSSSDSFALPLLLRVADSFFLLNMSNDSFTPPMLMWVITTSANHIKQIVGESISDVV